LNIRQKMKLLAFDLARRTGFAIGETDCERPVSGFQTLGGNREEALEAFPSFFLRLVKEHEPKSVVFEAVPLNLNMMKTAATAELLYGLSGQVRGLSAYLKLNPWSIGVFEVRKHFVGQARPKDKKDAIVRRCNEVGWAVKDHNEADALALWSCAAAKRFNRVGETGLGS